MINMPDKIDNCKVCAPIRSLLEVLLSKGFRIVDETCKDYHFHEVAFTVEGKEELLSESDFQNIENIKIHENGKYYCTCHWSKVQIIVEGLKK